MDLIATRVMDAPPEELWRAWSEPDLVKRWWGPTGFTAPVAEMDLREGGISLVAMRAPEEFGMPDLYNTWTYEGVVPPERFVFVTHFTDADRNGVDPAALGLPPGIPNGLRSEVALRDRGDGTTELTVTEFGWEAGEQMEMSRQGLEQCLDKMAAIFGGPAS